MKILVTGGTGVLGHRIVERLRRHEQVTVAALSRRPPTAPGRSSDTHLRVDLDSGAGLARALDGASVVVHCASSADYRRPERDVAATRRLIEAAASGRPPHLVYISIVGVDRVRFGYYRAKLATEALIARSGLPWTVLRTTQFHELVLMFMNLLSRGPVALVPRETRVQPVDVAEVADRMVELALGDPAGRVPDLGGPLVESAETLMRTYLAASGRRRPVLSTRWPGRAAADFRAGGHLPEDGVRGRRSFADFLRSEVRADGSLPSPYRRRRR